MQIKLAHTGEPFLNYKILKFDQINILQRAIFMFKWYKAEVPAWFNPILMTNNKTHDCNTCFEYSGNNRRTAQRYTNCKTNS